MPVASANITTGLMLSGMHSLNRSTAQPLNRSTAQPLNRFSGSIANRLAGFDKEH